MEDIYGYLRYTANLISTSRFGNKMVLKGGSVLISKLIECNRTDMYRLTTDLDIHCNSRELWIDFYSNIEQILNCNGMGYVYKIVKRRSSEKGLDASDSLKFNLYDHGKLIEFKMDMNIKANNIITVEYSPILNMMTYDALTMLADKIVAVSSQKVFRRIKDMYDIAVLASLYNFSYYDILQHIRVKHPNCELKNMLVGDNFVQLEHAYSKYMGITNKPEFRDLLGLCNAFLEPVYLNYNGGNLLWNSQASRWVKN